MSEITKVQLINKEIEEYKETLERLEKLKEEVSGGTLEVCPQCGTKNNRWYTSGHWCCALC